ncbi:hypothetical protein [Nonomuraea sp. NEAU-A123]|uniref:hypothetical protein n=1 Tax=Nonomuraea sp. NEAU-A123 TaxID=2839649 RepID=UPI001BE465B1|nr:hypothetical protein [Nonomuraea sp. NEAU-A123]MBT2235076.1 hypothetical protein [Nonomuraea sp. NEAU-A123]
MPTPPSTRFPHVKQVFLIELYVYDLAWKPLSKVAVQRVTDLVGKQAGPGDSPNSSAASGRSRIKIITSRTLPSTRIAAESAPPRRHPFLTTMRSYAISALRLLNFTNIAEGTRWARDDFRNPLIALGLTM